MSLPWSYIATVPLVEISSAVVFPHTTMENSAKLEFEPPVLAARVTSSAVDVGACKCNSSNCKADFTMARGFPDFQRNSVAYLGRRWGTETSQQASKE